MLASLLFGCVAFLLAFVAKRDTGGLVYFGNVRKHCWYLLIIYTLTLLCLQTSTVAHFVIGITVMALHIANVSKTTILVFISNASLSPTFEMDIRTACSL